MIGIISIPICAILYAVKGGQHWRLRIAAERAAGISHDQDKHPIKPLTLWQRIVSRAMDGKVLSALGFGLLTVLVHAEYLGMMAGGPVYVLASGSAVAFLAGVLAWLVAVAPSMGEEAGAVGGYKGAWGEYVTDGFGRSYGVKKAVQRGVFTGAVLALVFWHPAVLLAGATFPVAYFIGISIEQYRTKQAAASWHLAELIYGAAIGAGIAVSV